MSLYYISEMNNHKKDSGMKRSLNNGIHDISNEVYHSSEGLSRSGLWEFKRSPMHYWNKYLSPNATPMKPSPQMKLGELVHALVLEPEKFKDRYIIESAQLELPKVGLLKDVGREEYEKQKKAREVRQNANQLITSRFLKDAVGKEIVSRDAYEEAKAMAESALSDATGQHLFADAKVEQSIYFTHKNTGLQCKVRPDAWLGSLVTDLKTTKDASYKGFQNAAHTSGYFMQAAMIKYGLETIGIGLEKFVFYCVEKTTGYPCVYYILDDEAIDYGTNQFNTLMEQYAHCLDKNEWGSYEPQTLCLPNYAKNEEY